MKEFADLLETRQKMQTDELVDEIAIAIRDFVIAGSPSLVNFAENWPRYWNDQAMSIAVALRKRFDITEKS